MTTKTSSPKIGPGTKFHSTYADGNPQWEVTKSLGRAVWEAKCLGPDYDGMTKAFKTSDIQHSLRMASFFSKNSSDHDRFYAGLTLGQIVHYSNGFGEFVRCEAVMGTTVHNAQVHKCLKPVALVGTWKSYDLPRRNPNGTINYGYHAGAIAKGECFEPNYANIYESGSDSTARYGADPSKLPALDLTVPELSADAEATAKLWKAVEAAREVLENHKVTDPKARLQGALATIQAGLAN